MPVKTPVQVAGLERGKRPMEGLVDIDHLIQVADPPDFPALPEQTSKQGDGSIVCILNIIMLQLCAKGDPTFTVLKR